MPKKMGGLKPQVSLKHSRLARDRGMAQVLEGTDFTERVSQIVMEEFNTDDVVTGEEIRLKCLEFEVRPHHYNAWGAAINALIKKGQLISLDNYVPSKVIASHAAKRTQYRVNNAF